MKNDTYKDINFFEPKIDINIDEKDIFIKQGLLKNSIKIYIVVFCITMIYLVFNTIKVNIKYNSVQRDINEIQESELTSNSLKSVIEEQTMLTDIFNKYNQNNKVSSDILNQIQSTKTEQISIGEINWTLDSITLSCFSTSEKDAILFTNKLRENENFKNIVYTGGNSSLIDGTFKFELNIII